jgi:nucleoside-diphosphate-sugar epimerase
MGVLQCIHNNLWGDDWNLASESPYTTREIVNMISEITGRDLSTVIKWHSKTDYLGNHRLSSEKVRKTLGWKPLVSLKEGIEMSFKSILNSKGYNPLVHLEEANDRKIDLTEFFPEV